MPAKKQKCSPPGSIKRGIDPSCDEENESVAFSVCDGRRETRAVQLRAQGLTHREIANAIGMSTGWTCESLASVRSRCGWQNAVRAKQKPRKKRAEDLRCIRDELVSKKQRIYAGL